MLQNKPDVRRKNIMMPFSQKSTILEYWQILSLKKANSNTESDNPITPTEWDTHFEKILSTQGNDHKIPNFETKIKENLQKIIKRNTNHTELNKDITDKEITEEAKQLKNKKAVGPDSISNEMIKTSIPTMLPILKRLYNQILKQGIFPNGWNTDFLSPIHKNGAKDDPNNYRGISVSSCIGKLFCRIINTRITNYIHENGIIKDEQLGLCSQTGMQVSICYKTSQM